MCKGMQIQNSGSCMYQRHTGTIAGHLTETLVKKCCCTHVYCEAVLAVVQDLGLVKQWLGGCVVDSTWPRRVRKRFFPACPPPKKNALSKFRLAPSSFGGLQGLRTALSKASWNPARCAQLKNLQQVGSPSRDADLSLNDRL